jgi:protein-tyrosine phosphatase
MNGEAKRRLIKFEGLSNFRDIGGLKTEEGRRVKTGILFRSDRLSGLTSRDLKKMYKLNIKLICDLRTPKELKKNPNQNSFSNTKVVNIPIYHNEQELSHWRLFKFIFGRTGADEFEYFIKEYYKGIAFKNTEKIKQVITLIADRNNVPALIHCNVGRDRTGFISAIIQLLLGVPRKKVIEDYLLTNIAFEQRILRFVKYIRRLSLFQVSEKRLQYILQARSEHLEEIIDRIAERYGNVEDYLTKGCGLDPQCLDRLRNLLIT